MMNEDLKAHAKARLDEAVRQTQVQTEEAAAQIGGLLRVGFAQIKKAAGTVADAIVNDINSRP
jgi:hypothetical protein